MTEYYKSIKTDSGGALVNYTEETKTLKAQLKDAEEVIDNAIKLQNDGYGNGIQTHLDLRKWVTKAREYKTKYSKSVSQTLEG